jgi:hypothetical protein
MLIGTSGQQDEVTGTFWMEPPLIFLIFLFLSTSLFFLCPQWCKAVMLGLSVYSSLVCGLYVPINLGKNLNHRCTFICGTEGVHLKHLQKHLKTLETFAKTYLHTYVRNIRNI